MARSTQTLGGFSITAMMNNEQAQTLLGKGFLWHAFGILWRSVALAAFWSGVDYLARRKTFTREDVIFNFVACVIMFSLFTFFGLLMAAGRYRKRPKNWDDDRP